MVSLKELQQEAELRRKMDKSPKYTKGCVIIGMATCALLAYGAWTLHSMHQSTTEFSRKLKVGQTPSKTNEVHSGLGLNISEPAIKFDDHLNGVLQHGESNGFGWFNTERRGDSLVLSDSICWQMKQPTERTDVKSYWGIQVEEMTSLLEKYPKIVEGYKHIILHLGTNNIGHDGNPAKDIHALYVKLFNKIKQLNPNCTIFSSAILPRPEDHQKSQTKVNEVNALLSGSFQKYFIQYGQSFADFSTPNEPKFTKDLFNPDGLHLTTSGGDVLSDKFRQALEAYQG